ncbi:class I SAM-dependent methyltransferase [Cytophagaceae bacterium ABcell3]|nr:class I SAM-dependent methyltransferase [Cytophagaceae bacterium ABcell3]
METLNQCPSCTGTTFTDYLKLRDYSITKERFQLVKCTKCGLIFTNPRPPESEIGRYYKSEEYVSHSDSNKGLINFLYHQVRKFTLKGKTNLINRLSDKGAVLDIGCGTGYFLAACKKEGWEITGTEPDAKAAEIAAKNTNSSIYPNLFSVPNRSYEIITLWHVLEHIHELKKSMAKVKSLLADQGTLIVAVPNCQSYDAKVYKEKWAAYDVPRHLYHFVPESMEYLMKSEGLEITDIKPMYFDSFYVSMISEKYKRTGSVGLIKAVINGMLSNLKAGKSKYSSLIYIIKKSQNA